MKRKNGAYKGVKVFRILQAEAQKGNYYTMTSFSRKFQYTNGFLSREWINSLIRKLIAQGFIERVVYGDVMHITNRNIDEFWVPNLPEIKRKQNLRKIINVLEGFQSENIYYSISQFTEVCAGFRIDTSGITIRKLLMELADEGYVKLVNSDRNINVVMLTDKKFQKETQENYF